MNLHLVQYQGHLLKLRNGKQVLSAQNIGKEDGEACPLSMCFPQGTLAECQAYLYNLDPTLGPYFNV